MKIKNIRIKNFRRLECVDIDIESDETVFVGANNSGKTSATAAMRCFIDNKDFKVHDFSSCCIHNWQEVRLQWERSTE